MNSGPSTRVLLCSYHPYARLGLRTVIASDASMVVVGETHDSGQVRRLTATLQPDVVVLEADVSQSGALSDLQPTIVVVVDTAETAVEWMTYTYANVGAVVHKEAPTGELIQAVRNANTGRGYISPSLGGALLAVVRSRLPRSRATLTSYSPLTSRERDVLDLLQRGMANKEIAQELQISEKTVKFHVSNVLAKCQMTSRSALIACGWSERDRDRHVSAVGRHAPTGRTV